MTTLSEYKAMMEGATDDSVEQSYTFFHTIKEWEALKASREIAPSLIRVIELAEELTLEIQQKNHLDFDKVSYLREEIRKLRGE